MSRIKTNSLPLYFFYAFIILGVVIRAYIFFDNRNLFIDESNLARNIFEKNILELWMPLDYEQYAPPIFLIITKLLTLCFGYGEMAFRLLPFACAIASFVFMYKILRLLNLLNYAWFAAGTMALSPILIRYSCEFKQYSIDFLASTILIYYGIRWATEYTNTHKASENKQFKPKLFFLSWLFLGSSVIWISMPSVFSLAGIGGLFFYLFYQNKSYKFLGLFATISFVWLIQFCLYYWFILREQAFSEYLQNFHAGYFLYFSGMNKEQLIKNVKLVFGIAQNLFNGKAIFIALVILLFGGFFKFIIKSRKNYLYTLLLTPFIFLVLAAGLKTYSLIPRLLLFVYPSILIVITIGVREIFETKHIKVGFVILSIICLSVLFADTLKKPLKVEEITDVLDRIKDREKINDTRKILTQFAQPAFHYYTQIHPNKQHYESLHNNLIFLEYGDNLCLKLKEEVPKDSMFIFIASCLYPPEIYSVQKKCVLEQSTLIESHTAPSAEVLIAKMK